MVIVENLNAYGETACILPGLLNSLEHILPEFTLPERRHEDINLPFFVLCKDRGIYIGLVFEIFDDLQDFGPGLCRYFRPVVQDTVNRPVGHAGCTSNIFDCHFRIAHIR